MVANSCKLVELVDLNHEIARAKGWEPAEGYLWQRVCEDGQHVKQVLPCWSVNLFAAMGLFAEMPHGHLQHFPTSGYWCSACYDSPMENAPTAELAICRAWLSWKRGEDARRENA